MYMLNNFRYNLFIIITLFCNNIFAQKVIFNNPVNNYLLYELENPIDYLVEDYNCNNINFKITNAEFTKCEGCKLLVRPTSKEPVIIEAYIDNKLLDSTVFNVKMIKPNIVLHSPFIEGKYNYNLADKLIVDFNEYRIDLPIKIEQYEMIIVQNDKILLRQLYNSPVFDKLQKENLSKLKKGDLIIFKNMILKNIDNSKYNDSIKIITFEVN